MIRIAHTKVLKNCTVYLPSTVREALNLEFGDDIGWYVDNENIIFKKEAKLDAK